MSDGDAAPRTKKPRAAFYCPVLSDHFVGIEHPFIINNVERGVQTLGGLPAIAKLLKEHEQHESNDKTNETEEMKKHTAARLYLKPGNRESKPILSNSVSSCDIVLKVTMPRRTGRRRKRSSDDPFLASNDDPSPRKCDSDGSRIIAGIPSASPKAEYLLRSLRDNRGRYTVTAIGHIRKTHRFRNLPFYVMSGSNNAFMQKIRDTILPFKYENMKEFQLDQSQGPQSITDLVLPPRSNFLTTPFNYGYRQNPGVKESLDGHGKPSLVNDGSPVLTHNQHTPFDSRSVPTNPSPFLSPLSALDPPMQRIITQARDLFSIRPIWTRRALFNNLPPEDLKAIGHNGIRYIQQYCGYTFDSGPWRDTIVRFGVDPRRDPECRFYQTMMFQLEPKAMSKRGKEQNSLTKQDREREMSESHIFDGEKVHRDGKVWQVCDVTEPLLKRIFENATLREKCHIRLDGWYQNAAYAKGRMFMKHMMRKILEGNPLGDEYFTVFDRIPDILNQDTREQFKPGRAALKDGSFTKEQLSMLGDIRGAALRSPADEGWDEEGEESGAGENESAEEDDITEREDDTEDL